MKTSEQKLRKIRNAAGATGLVIGFVELLLIGMELSSLLLSNEEADLVEYYPGYKTLFSILAALMLVALIICLSVDIYIRLERKDYKQVPSSSESPLQGAAREHEQQIIDLLKSISKPSAGKPHLNRAPTAQFLRALTELSYMDANLSGPNLLAWVENVTGYKDKDDDSGHFFAAYNKPTKEDSKVLKYMNQIEQIITQ